MSTIQSPVDEYGFHRPDDFDYSSYEEFMSSYVRVLARRASRWNSFMKGLHKVRKTRRAKRFVRKGIPSELRAQVWVDISGARKKMKLNPGVYQQLTANQQLDEQTMHSIGTDIDRTFPDNIYFNHKQHDLRPALFNVLVAYATHNPRIGYCQGLNYIAGLMLLIVRKEEVAFWLLEVIVGKLLPDYYAKDMLGLKAEQETLREVVRVKIPDLFDHIEKIGVSYTIFSTKWFICLYIDVLPVETVLRIWDCLFYEGSKVILRVALTLMNLQKEKLMACQDFVQLCEAMKGITKGPSTMDCHSFMEHTFQIPGSFSRKWIKELRKAATERISEGQH
ncbi:growth hormone-regulated TBC protein 1-A-like [Montipora capricornis]|uniref:growth hormone-regulated TBC protein 1-A-like n=1 Tax=Montipora foliosa TaxID=591990 RepID=UPI0035F1A1ED